MLERKRFRGGGMSRGWKTFAIWALLLVLFFAF